MADCIERERPTNHQHNQTLRIETLGRLQAANRDTEQSDPETKESMKKILNKLRRLEERAAEKDKYINSLEQDHQMR